MKKPQSEEEDRSWSEIACDIERQTGHDPTTVAIGLALERLGSVPLPRRRCGADTVRRVANVIGSEGDINSRSLARILIAAAEGLDVDVAMAAMD